MTEATHDMHGANVGDRPAAVSKRWLGALFDLSFTSFLTPDLIKVAYIVLIALECLFTFSILVSAFQVHAAVGVFALLISPFIFLFQVAWARILLELIIVAFRIHDNLKAAPRL